MEKRTNFLIESCKKLDIELTERQTEQFLTYFEFLVEKNKVMNLTGITEYQEVVLKHFVDSLSLNRAVTLNGNERLLDMGTGAGFPGIPLKIVYPDLDVVLVDSLNKRIKFLDELIDKCRFEKIETIHGRAEEVIKKNNYRESFDFCVSRAVANLASLSEYCMPYVKVGGYFIPYKSGNIEEELLEAAYAIKILGGQTEQVVSFMLPDSEIGRSMPVIKKISSTPGKYPRKAGIPSKEPLKKH